MYIPAVNSLIVTLGGTVFALLAILLLVVLICVKRVRTSEQRAHTDPTTGLLNGYGLDRKSKKLLSGANPQYAVVTMQLRNYRQLTQTFGRGEGNRVLQYLSKILKSNLSAMEPIARVSGGVFCMLLKNRDENAIRARLTRVYESANLFNQNIPVPYVLDLRFGIYIPEKNDERLSDILEKIGEPRKIGDQRCNFVQEKDPDAAARKWDLIQQMERSFKNGDFLVYLQPKVRLSDNRIVGAEALIRWRHPQRGMLTPDMFVSTLEEYHLLPQYDLYLFEQVCRQMERWSAKSMAICPVSVNLSVETVRQPDFMRPYLRLAEKYKIAPEFIEFELSLSLQRQNLEELKQVVAQIHGCNFRCALDKYGSDSSTLYLLRELDVDTIKLDHNLFSSENNNRRNRFVLEAFIKIASQLQIRTIAEGISNGSQVQYLRQAGCDVVQGYYYFKPMSVEEFSYTAYFRNELRYVEEEGKKAEPSLFTSGSTTSGNIIMFSLLTSTDSITFSSLFSPVLEQQHTVANATALFRRSDLIHENDREDFLNLLERCVKENDWVENTMRFYTSNGRYEWLEVHMHKEYIPAVGETVISGTLVNVAGWKKEVTRWKEKATRDALTGLYNHEYFEQFAQSTIKPGATANAAIVFIDIDDFKKVNDTMGHMVGDDVICWFAKRVQGVFRQSDIVARYGGDEFVVFANGITKADLNSRLQQLCDALRTPYQNGDTDYKVSGSIGAAMFPADGATYEEVLECADSALYEAKRQGKNRFVLFRSGMEQAPQQ